MKLGNHGKPFSRLIALTITLFQGGRELVTTICKSPVMSLFRRELGLPTASMPAATPALRIDIVSRTGAGAN